jgi:hypothetical protein
MLIRVQKALKYSCSLGLAVAIMTAVRLVVAVETNKMHYAPALLFMPLRAFATAALPVFLLIASGAATPNKRRKLDVSPWFAWLVAGGFLAFLAGLFSTKKPEGGLVAAAIWVGGIAVLYVTLRLSGARSSS